MVYQDHLTKFVVLHLLQKKSADLVVNHLLDIFFLFGSPDFLQSDNGREFKEIYLAAMIRDKWPECEIVPELLPQRQTNLKNGETICP